MKKAVLILVLALASPALISCASSGGNGITIQVETNPNGDFSFTTTKALAKADENLTIDFYNPQPVGHNLEVLNENGGVVGKAKRIAEGGESLILKDLKPGEYRFFCSVPTHRELGMEGVLIVK